MPIQLGTLVLYNVEEFSAKFGLHVVTVRKLIRQGRIKGRKMGNRWYVSEDAFRDYFRETPVPKPPEGKA
jgi:excisionase family DNA binding protein